MSARVRSHKRGLDNGLHLLQTENTLASPFPTAELNTGPPPTSSPLFFISQSSDDIMSWVSRERPSSILKPIISPLQSKILHVFLTLSTVLFSGFSGSSSSTFPPLARFPTERPALGAGPMEVRCHGTQAGHQRSVLLAPPCQKFCDDVPSPSRKLSSPCAPWPEISEVSERSCPDPEESCITPLKSSPSPTSGLPRGRTLR